MNVAHQFEQIGIFLTQDRFVPVLEQVPMAAVAAVETDGMAGQQPQHKAGDRGRTGSQQQMKMVGNQRPSVTEGCGTFNEAPIRSRKL